MRMCSRKFIDSTSWIYTSSRNPKFNTFINWETFLNSATINELTFNFILHIKLFFNFIPHIFNLYLSNFYTTEDKIKLIINVKWKEIYNYLNKLKAKCVLFSHVMLTSRIVNATNKFTFNFIRFIYIQVGNVLLDKNKFCSHMVTDNNHM